MNPQLHTEMIGLTEAQITTGRSRPSGRRYDAFSAGGLKNSLRAV
jgi:hypothetical protein